MVFISLKENEGTPLLKEELRNFVVDNIGAIAKPDDLIFLNKLPKLRNGKIDRHALREIAYQEMKELNGFELENFELLERLRDEYQSFEKTPEQKL